MFYKSNAIRRIIIINIIINVKIEEIVLKSGRRFF